LSDVNLPLILLAAFIGAASPGPSTLMIAGTSMNAGRRYGVSLALGVLTGSWFWSFCAAFGLGAIMLANAWAFEVMRYFGAGYLLFLAYKSGRSALSAKPIVAAGVTSTSLSKAYSKGLTLHLTNPKAILFFGSLFSIAVPPGSPLTVLVVVICAVGIQSTLMFIGYALLFSSAPMVAIHMRLRRWFEAVFAVAFGIAGFKILTARLS
jgi:threonine efflux protein